MGNNTCNEGSTATVVTTPPTMEISHTTLFTDLSTSLINPATVVGSGGIVTTLCTTVGISPTPAPFALGGEGVAIAPNPFSNEINISCAANEPSEIILYDITSRKLLQQTFTKSTSINTSQLSKGIYIYEVKNPDSYRGGMIENGKLVKE
jgi:hypothetical protein